MQIEDRKTETFKALAVPFGEVGSGFESGHAPHAYSWPEIRVPKSGREMVLTLNHDGPAVGIATEWAKTTSGVTCKVKLGRAGLDALSRGIVGLSATIASGDLVGLALVAEPAFDSAKVLVEDPSVVAFSSDAPLRFGLDPATGLIAFRPPPQPSPADMRPAIDLGRHRQALMAFSTGAVDAEVEDRRRRFRERREELAQQDVEREESRLREAGVPTSLWPAHLPGA